MNIITFESKIVGKKLNNLEMFQVNGGQCVDPNYKPKEKSANERIWETVKSIWDLIRKW